jgi:branched-chain amino acid transport system permease protein
VGYTGQLSVGQAAFYGIGSYTSALLTTALGWPFWLGFAAAGLVAALFGLAIGPITRLKGVFLAVATLAFGEIVRIVVINWVELTNGPNGISRVPSPFVGPIELGTDQRYYYLILATLAFGYFTIHRLINSRVGRAMTAIRDNEDGAAATGVHVARYKVMVFAVAAFFAGLAGSLYAHLIGYISPENLVFLRSVEVIFMIVLGGVGSLPGSILGSAVVVAAPEMLRFAEDARLLVYSAVIVLVLVFVPGGLAGLLAGAWRLVTRRRGRPSVEAG